MNQAYKFRYDQLKEGNPTDQTPSQPVPSNHTEYDAPGHARNLCLVWQDNRQMFFNYAYLVSAEFKPHGETNEIRLNFSGQTAILKGYNLERLFLDLLDHLPRMIYIEDKRYVSTDPENECLVIEIIIEDEK